MLGIGLNLGMTRAEAEAIDQPATSVLVETGSAPSPREVLPGLLRRLTPWLEAWTAGGFAALRAGWEARCAGLGERVTVVDGGQRLSGVLAGFGDGGQLLPGGGRGCARGLGGEPVARSGLRAVRVRRRRREWFWDFPRELFDSASAQLWSSGILDAVEHPVDRAT